VSADVVVAVVDDDDEDTKRSEFLNALNKLETRHLKTTRQTDRQRD
jgi:hypothetical protein